MSRVRRRTRRDPNLGPWVRVYSPQALEAALKLARGNRQRELLLGWESYSGSTAKERGIGTTFRNLYRKGHDRLLNRLTNAGVEWRLEDVATRTIVKTPFQEKVLVLESFRDPKQTLDRIRWLAKKAEKSLEARQVLHDAFLQAHDVPMARPVTRERTLAAEYEWYIRQVEREARDEGRKRVILLERRRLAKTVISHPFGTTAYSVTMDGLPAGWVAVYLTQAGFQ